MNEKSELTAQPSGITRVELDKAACPCGNKECDEIYLKALCHPRAGMMVCYNQKTGILEVRCFQCEEMVSKIKVAAN